MTKFIDAHFTFMLQSSSMRRYVRFNVVPPLLKVGVCVYEPSTKKFIPLNAMKAEAKIYDMVEQGRIEQQWKVRQQQLIKKQGATKDHVSQSNKKGCPASRINFKRSKEKQAIVYDLVARLRIPFNDVAFYPSTSIAVTIDF